MKINIEDVTLYVSEDFNPYHTAFWTFEPVDFETAQKLWMQGKAYRFHAWDFWGSSVFQFNYVDEEHREEIVDFLINNGVGEKRAKRVAAALIKDYKQCEDLQGVEI